MIKPKQNKEPTTETLSWAETKLQIADLIEESFSNPRLEEMKSIGLRQMEIFERDLQDEVLESAVQDIGVAKFSKFLVAFGCFATIEDYYYDIENILDDEEPETFSDLVEEFIDKDCIDEINKIKAFLMLSKDSIINDFVIPNYKVSKASHIWLEEQTERALNKAIDKHFNFVNHYNLVFDFVKYASEFDFETADHVSIFEYFMEMKSSNHFFIQGMKAGYSEHCLRQYPSGFPKGEKSFPRAFIHRKDEEGQLKICEAIEFVKGLPTELDQKIGDVLIENMKWNERFVQEQTTINCYNFDGVNALARDCNLPYMEDKFGLEIYEIFRDMVSKMSLSELYCLKENFENHCDEGIKTKSLRDWVAFYDYLSLELLSKKVEVPKKILKHYKRIFNSCANDCWNGNY